MINESDLDKKIEQIVEKRIEDRLEGINGEETKPHENHSAGAESAPSRRCVLNALVGGAAGFGLANVFPSTSLFGESATSGFEVNSDGDIDLNGNEIVGVGHLNFNNTAVEIGTGASANRNTEAGGFPRYPIAIGNNARATQLNCIAIGNDQDGPTEATADDAMAIGPDNAKATAENAYAIGEGTMASGSESIAIGKAARATEIGTVALGSNTRDTSSAAAAHSPYAVAIGADASINSNMNSNSIAIGRECSVSGSDSVAVGANAEVTSGAERSIAFGTGTTVETSGVARIGDGSGTNGPDQLVFTAEQDTIADDDLNSGEMTVEMDEANNAFRLRGKDSEGTIQEATISW
jgi:hypothetical protein